MRTLLLLAMVALSCAVNYGTPHQVPLGEDDEAENYDLNGIRQAMPADVFLQATEGESTGADPVAVDPVIDVSGGAQIHVGPQTQMTIEGGGIEIQKGSKVGVSQTAKVVSK